MFRYIVFLVVFIPGSLMAGAQVEEADEPMRTDIVSHPVFPGGHAAIQKIFNDNVRYPQSALNENIGGEVRIIFIIDTLGNVSVEKIRIGIREDLDNEAIRLTHLIQGWTPCTQNGKKIAFPFLMEIFFIPNEKFEETSLLEGKIPAMAVRVYGYRP